MPDALLARTLIEIDIFRNSYKNILSECMVSEEAFSPVFSPVVFLLTFLLQIFSWLCFFLRYCIKTVRLLLAAVRINPFTLRAAKRGLTFLEIFPFQKHFLKTFEWEMLIRRQTTNLLRIFCEISLHSQFIFKSIKIADDISRGTLECEWVKLRLETLCVCVCLCCCFQIIMQDFSRYPMKCCIMMDCWRRWDEFAALPHCMCCQLYAYISFNTRCNITTYSGTSHCQHLVMDYWKRRDSFGASLHCMCCQFYAYISCYTRCNITTYSETSLWTPRSEPNFLVPSICIF